MSYYVNRVSTLKTMLPSLPRAVIAINSLRACVSVVKIQRSVNIITILLTNIVKSRRTFIGARSQQQQYQQYDDDDDRYCKQHG